MCNASYVQHDTQSIYWPGMDIAGFPWVWQEGLSEHTVSVHLRTAARQSVCTLPRVNSVYRVH